MEDQVKELTENSITYPNFYCFEGEHPKGVGNNVGNLVRIATSISAKAKALLIGSYLTIENKLNEEYKMNEKFISYCDTDSIYLDISKIVLVELRKMYDSMDPAV